MIDAILEFLIYAVFPFLKRRKRRKEEWMGFLEEIEEKSGSSLAKSRHQAVFRTDDGRKIKLRLRESDASRYEKGIRYHKKAGEDFPSPFA